MKLGILGTGMIVKALLPSIHLFGIDTIELLGTEATREETEELCRQYSLHGACYDYDELLDSDVDTIYVALPNYLHYSFAKKALLRKKHVIIEKPVTANAKELKELAELAKDNQRIMLEAMNIHYLPAYQSIKGMLGQIGDIKIISFNYSQYSSRYHAFKEGNILPAFDPEKAGGALMDLNVYNLHAIIGLFGKPKRVSYFANIERNIDTSGILFLDYGTFKAVSIGAKDCKAPVSSTIQGDKGYIRLNLPVNQITGYELCTNEGMKTMYSYDEGKHRLYYEFAEFVRIIDNLDESLAGDMLKISLSVAEVMEEARKQEGIVFGNDR